MKKASVISIAIAGILLVGSKLWAQDVDWNDPMAGLRNKLENSRSAAPNCLQVEPSAGDGGQCILEEIDGSRASRIIGRSDLAHSPTIIPSVKFKQISSGHLLEGTAFTIHPAAEVSWCLGKDCAEVDFEFPRLLIDYNRNILYRGTVIGRLQTDGNAVVLLPGYRLKHSGGSTVDFISIHIDRMTAENCSPKDCLPGYRWHSPTAPDDSGRCEKDYSEQRP